MKRPEWQRVVGLYGPLLATVAAALAVVQGLTTVRVLVIVAVAGAATFGWWVWRKMKEAKTDE